MTNLIVYSLTLSLVAILSCSAYATRYETKIAKLHQTLSGEADAVSAEDTNIEKLPDAIIYHSIAKNNSDSSTLQFNKEVWFEPGRQNYRRQMLEEFYFANSRTISISGRKNIACYTGNVNRILDFLADDNTKVEIDGIDKVMISVSEDKKMIGIEYYIFEPKMATAIHRHFRMPHCIQGSKSPLLSLDMIRTASNDKKAIDRMVASLQKKEARKPNAATTEDDPRPENTIGSTGPKAAASAGGVKAALNDDGYTQQDFVADNVKLAFEKLNKRNLPTFKIRANYADFKPTEKSRPWVGKVGDIRLPGEAEKLSQIILDFFYDSLIVDSVNVENNLIAQNSAFEKSILRRSDWII